MAVSGSALNVLYPAGRKLVEMNSPPKFRVVGIRTIGERVVISQHASREAAERVVSVIQFGSQYSEIIIDEKSAEKSAGRKRLPVGIRRPTTDDAVDG